MISTVAYEGNKAYMNVIEAQGTMIYDIADWLEDKVSQLSELLVS